MSRKPWGILPESQTENALEFRTFLSSSFVLELAMREEDQGFRVSCTLQSKFPHQVTWVLQHLGFVLYANVWPECSLAAQHHFVSELCR